MTYPGGKGGSGVAQTLISLMPPHNVYIEPFLGSGAVLRAKLPARLRNVGIDVSREALELTLAAIDGDWDLVATEMAFPAGTGGSDDEISQYVPGPIVVSSDSAGETGKPDDAYRRPTPKLELLQADAIGWLYEHREHLPASALVYCDPPYVRSSRRKSRALYEFEMTDEQHTELLGVLKSLNCMVLLSGYESELYTQELVGWNHLTFHTTNRAGARTTEHVWFNYPKPVELHDYRYLGNGFRERERIKRKMKRWATRLERMPDLERQALLWAVTVRSATVARGNPDCA